MPLAAAATNTDAGRQWFATLALLVLAFTSVGAMQRGLVVVIARMWAPQDPNHMTTEMQFRGMLMIAVMAFLLPAMLRLVFPLAAAAAGNEATALSLANTTVATGSRILRR
jgi:hypothetical protein